MCESNLNYKETDDLSAVAIGMVPARVVLNKWLILIVSKGPASAR
jgi:hypothetical protein